MVSFVAYPFLLPNAAPLGLAQQAGLEPATLQGLDVPLLPSRWATAAYNTCPKACQNCTGAENQVVSLDTERLLTATAY